MYFSNHNEKITYINHYSGLLEVEGEGVLCREDATDVWGETGTGWASSYDVLSVTEGITAIGEGYLECFPKIVRFSSLNFRGRCFGGCFSRICKADAQKEGADPRRIRFLRGRIRGGEPAPVSALRHPSRGRRYRDRS